MSTQAFRSLFLAALSLLLAATAHGTTVVMPYSYATASPDGRYVFVMLSMLSPEGELQHWNEEWKARISKVRSKYPHSGMYRNDGSTQPLWTVGWYSFHVHVASDGAHVVARDGFHSGRLFFVENGTLLRSYSIARELSDVGILEPLQGFPPTWLDSESFDEGSMTYTIQTVEKNYYTFDVRTGRMIQALRPLRLLLVLLETLIAALLAWRITRALRQRGAGGRATSTSRSLKAESGAK